jgi:hypothetical protein
LVDAAGGIAGHVIVILDVSALNSGPAAGCASCKRLCPAAVLLPVVATDFASSPSSNYKEVSRTKK